MAFCYSRLRQQTTYRQKKNFKDKNKYLNKNKSIIPGLKPRDI